MTSTTRVQWGWLGWRRWVGLGAVAAVGGAAGRKAVGFARGRRRAESEAAAGAAAGVLQDLGAVTDLRIVPLVDALATSDHLRTQHGVSYLVIADGLRILFDVGMGARRGLSPVVENAVSLGVDLDDLDLVVLSHHHPDHTGGWAATWQHTFSLADPDGDLSKVTVLTPVPMSHPVARCELAAKPRTLAPGVATTGTLPRMLFWLGWTPEQALIVNVAGKGAVVVVGCGHQGLGRLLDRVEELGAGPVHAVVGGLHLPVHGLIAQEVVGTGKWPWQHTTERDVDDVIGLLERRHPALVAVSPHDSSAWTLDRLAGAFGDRYRTIRVGETIHIAAA